MKKRGRWILLIVSIVLFSFINVNSAYSQTDPPGCCINPGAGPRVCTSSMILRSLCCPVFQQGSPYYDIPNGGPNSQADCYSNFFRQGTSCSLVSECQVGCCCIPNGGSLKTEAECTGTNSVFKLGETDCVAACAIPQCNDGVDNDNNGCADTFDTGCFGSSDNDESGGTCLQQTAGCDNPSYNPKLTNLRVVPVKGERKLQLTWQDECSSKIASYDIYRCQGSTCTNFAKIGSSATASFEDSSDLLFDVSNDITIDEFVYRYKVSANYATITAVPETQPVTANIGDIECFGRYDSSVFCVSEYYYDRSSLIKNYLLAIYPATYSTNFIQAVRNNFAGKINKSFSCDDKNNLNGPTKSCTSSQACVVANNVASCISKSTSQCISTNSNPFGMFSTQTDCEQTSAGARKYCFYDKSYSSVDSCFGCSLSMSCYDYKSEDSCRRDNCGISSCEWKPLADEIGLGVCVSSTGYNCKWCSSSFNDIFEICTKDKSDALSEPGFDCYYKQENSYNCNEIVCQDYLAGECSNAQITHYSDNSITNPSSDKCGIRTCQNIGGLCAKNADGDNLADCTTKDCEKDYFAPETIMSKTVAKNGLVDSLSLQIYDKNNSNKPAVLASPNGFTTYICAGTPTASCGPNGHPFAASTNSGSVQDREMIVSGLDLVDAVNGNLVLKLNEGANVLRFYSQDPSKNIEEINTIAFDASSSATEPDVIKIGVDNEPKVPVATTTKLYVKQAQSSIDVEFYDDAVIIFAQVYNKNNPSSPIVLTGNTVKAKIVSLLLPSYLSVGEYILELKAQSENGIQMSDLFNFTIIVDNVAPTLTIVPADGSMLSSSTVAVTLTFSEEVNLNSVQLNGADKTGDFSIANNPVFTTSLPLNDGNYNLQVTASDYAGNSVSRSVSFAVNAKPTEITLLQPKYNVSSSYVFDIVVGTDNNVNCRYSFDIQVNDFNRMTQFTTTGGTTHTISNFNRIASPDVSGHNLYVRCFDGNYALTSGQYKERVFNISVDTTEPVIASSSANPNPVIELPSADFPTNTILQARTNELSICKYSTVATASFDNMNEFENSFRRSHTQPIAVQSSSNYYVVCKNKAELLSDPATVNINVNLNAPFNIDTSGMSVLYPSSNVDLVIGTNKNVFCYYSDTDTTPLGTNCFGTSCLEYDGGFIHRKTLTSLSEGIHTYYVQCYSGPFTSDSKQINFYVDTTPPTMLFVNDTSTFANPPNPLAEITCDPTQPGNIPTQLRVSWLGRDYSYMVKNYSYAIYQEKSPSDEIVKNWENEIWFNGSDRNRWKWFNVPALADGATYFFRVKARDYIDLESPSKDSDGIRVDAEACRIPACGDGIFDPGELCEIRNGQAVFISTSINECTDYSDRIGGTLGCRLSDCTPDLTNCKEQPYCKDNILNSGEHCDNNLFGTANSCDDLSFDNNVPLTCADNCFLDTTSCIAKESCGNGIIDPGEECDGSNLGPILNGDCTQYSSLFSDGRLRCNNCKLDTSLCSGISGGSCNGVVLNRGEKCDGNVFGIVDYCSELGFAGGGKLGCTSGDLPNGCQLDTNSCTPTQKCGNRIIDPGEECDGTNLGILTTSCSVYSPYFRSGTLSCNASTCKLNTFGCVESPACGNGFLDRTEECDGSRFRGLTTNSCTSYSSGFVSGTLQCGDRDNDGDGCEIITTNCINKDVCGNRVIEPAGSDNVAGTIDDEECEIRADGSFDFGSFTNCVDYTGGASTGGNLNCVSCKIGTGGCSYVAEPKCGDGLINVAGEQCDTTSTGSYVFGDIDDCRDFTNLLGGTLKCNPADCTLDKSECARPVQCNNGRIDPGEACDRTNTGTITFGDINSCDDYSRFSGGTLSCNERCELDTIGCIQRPDCGNGIVDKGESCDGNNFGPLSSDLCEDYSSDFTGGSLSCVNCQISTSSCSGTVGGCNNGRIDKGEDCDGRFGIINDCNDYADFTGGSLSCNSCQLDTNSCDEIAPCGNGIVERGESCDTNYFGIVDGTCVDYSITYFKGNDLICTNCILNTGNCVSQLCGNSVLDTGEQCDLTVFDPSIVLDCSAHGNFISGKNVLCGNDCSISTSNCDPVIIPPTTGTITGKVRDVNGPLQGVSVIAGGVIGSTNANGAYTLDNVGAGTQTITATKAGYYSGTGTVIVTAGGSVTAGDVMLTPVPPPPTIGTITGLVKDVNGLLQGVSVIAGGVIGSTNANGAYTLDNVGAGTQTITATKAGYYSGTGTVIVTAGGSVTAGDVTLVKVPPPPGPACGDNQINQAGEDCDGGDLGGKRCEDYGYIGGNLGCTSGDLPNGCQVDKTDCTPPPACGDGNFDPGEACDDNGPVFGSIDSCLDYSNFIGGTLGCNQCEIDNTYCIRQPYCGDNKISPGEQCDENLFGTADSCADLGFASGIISCGDNCFLDTSRCVPKQLCNNGIIDSGEDCDGNNLGPLNNSCAAYDSQFTGGTLSCNNCKLNTNQCFGTSGTCNDGFINIGEACDGTNFGAITDCNNYDDFAGGLLSCTRQCTLNTTGCISISDCGNNLIDPGEQCDNNNLGFLSTSCTQYSRYFSGGTLNCTRQCTLNTTSCSESSLCGNGFIDGNEQCDNTNFANLTDLRCSAYNNEFVNGTLTCDSCSISAKNCKSSRIVVNVTCRDTGSCGLGENCTDGSDCQSRFCSNNRCAVSGCQDRVKNQNESDVDCGGSCGKCTDSKSCRADNDCLSGFCEFGLCKTKNTCSDGILNSFESDVDCGGLCDRCNESKNCNFDNDCGSNLKCINSSCRGCKIGDIDCDGVIDNPEASPDLDSDNDGMPDSWEIQNGLDPNDSSDAKKDNDKDGLTNLEEFNVIKEYGKSSNPNNEDTDGDRYPDKKEIDKKTSPVNASDFPKSGFGKILMFILGALVLVSGFGYMAYRVVQARQQGQFTGQGYQRAPQARSMKPMKVEMEKTVKDMPKTKEELAKIKELMKKKEEQKLAERKRLFGSFEEQKESPKPIKAQKPEIKKQLQRPEKKAKDVFSRLKQITKKPKK